MNRKSLYVPILRSHAAELAAVHDLRPGARAITAPLIEISRATASKLRGAAASKIAREVQELTGDSFRGELYLDLGALLDLEDFGEINIEVKRRLLEVRSLRPAAASNLVMRSASCGWLAGIFRSRRGWRRHGARSRRATVVICNAGKSQGGCERGRSVRSCKAGAISVFVSAALLFTPSVFKSAGGTMFGEISGFVAGIEGIEIFQ